MSSPAQRHLDVRSTWSTRLSDYASIAKPKIAIFIGLAVAVGAFLAADARPDWVLVGHTVMGVLLAAISSSAFNQWLERDTDALMERTVDRPLPSGRMSEREVLGLGFVTGFVGIAQVWIFAGGLAALLTAITLVSYVALYTPLKRRTSLNTLVGAVPGALPPVIGWAAVAGEVPLGAWTLFAIIFVWQFPHFLAIAWIYRDDYSRAGLKMLPTIAGGQALTARQVVGYSLVLVPVGLMPASLGLAGPTYFVVAGLLGLTFLGTAVLFAFSPSLVAARRLLWTSLGYLPLIFMMLVLDHQLG
ncbi:MAG: heme o synthase [Planctomycetota bacterium]